MIRSAIYCAFFIGAALGYTTVFNRKYDVTEPPKPIWNEVYTIKADLYMPFSDIVEPFTVWYDKNLEKSRVDYYDGMVKTYQVGKNFMYPNGAMFKVVPVTTDTLENENRCFWNDGSDYIVTIQSALPDMTNFTYKGEDKQKGHRWYFEVVEGEKTNKYDMWVEYRFDTAWRATAVPVRYEMRGINNIFGSFYDKSYIIYKEYNTSAFDSDYLQEPNIGDCDSFGGNVVRYASFNPLKEFIHPTEDEHVHHEFKRFKIRHNKNYENETEQDKRQNVFRHNLRYINSHNRAGHSYTLAVNHLADRTDDELAYLRGTRVDVRSRSDTKGHEFPYSASVIEDVRKILPKNYDWRIKGGVTAVKDQAVCGSCWAFSAIGAIEGAWFKKTKQLLELSEQAFLDCTWGYNNYGCDGGFMTEAFEWAMKHNVPVEEDYGKYLGQDGMCHIKDVTSSVNVTLTGWRNVPANNATALQWALIRYGPVTVAIDASQKSFTFYSNGIYNERRCQTTIDKLNHAVLIVGYGEQDKTGYWIVKNSYSNTWGNDGYIYFENRGENICGILAMPSYVEITKETHQAHLNNKYFDPYIHTTLV